MVDSQLPFECPVDFAPVRLKRNPLAFHVALPSEQKHLERRLGPVDQSENQAQHDQNDIERGAIPCFRLARACEFLVFFLHAAGDAGQDGTRHWRDARRRGI